jgi:hypothetical protein
MVLLLVVPGSPNVTGGCAVTLRFEMVREGNSLVINVKTYLMRVKLFNCTICGEFINELLVCLLQRLNKRC